MNNQDLDDLLQRIRHLAAHRPSPNFASNVWREIRKRKQAEKTNYRSSLAALLRPAFASAAVGLALAIGICGGVLSCLESQSEDAFGMDVFSAEPPALPSTVLGRMQ
jgi:hypothetical protein